LEIDNDVCAQFFGAAVSSNRVSHKATTFTSVPGEALGLWTLELNTPPPIGLPEAAYGQGEYRLSERLQRYAPRCDIL
jgi:hypothetical protein